MIVKNGKRLDIGLDTLPVGTIQPYAGSTPPNGYLKCNGGKVSKNVYPALWNICGDKYGTSTATEFYLPDMSDSNTAEVIWIIKAYYMPPQSSDSESSLETYATKEYVDSAIGDISIPDVSVFLSKTNTTAYTPSGNYNPATKKYVDDTAGNYISKTNTTAFTPSADYHPATKKYVDDNTIEDNGYSGVFCWDGKSSTTNTNNIALWQKVADHAKTYGSSLVYYNTTNRTSGCIFRIAAGDIPTTATTKQYSSNLNSISSVGSSVTGYGGIVSVTYTANGVVTSVTELGNSIIAYVEVYKYTATTNVVTSLNVTDYLKPCSWGMKVSSTTTGVPIAFAEGTPIILETRMPNTTASATYTPYIRQDLYAPALERHWFRTVHYAASNNIDYGTWKEIDLAFEVVEEW